ncbi:hypothetical protein J437_LFUL001397, partial [Ladona fulva]
MFTYPPILGFFSLRYSLNIMVTLTHLSFILIMLLLANLDAELLKTHATSSHESSLFAVPLHTNVTEGKFGEHYQFKVNSSIEYTFEYVNVSQLTNRTARIVVESINATKSYPVLIVVRQQKGVLSWQLPLIVSTYSGNDTEYQKVSRTLCPSKYYLIEGKESSVEEESVIVSVSTSSPVDVFVFLTVKLIDDFYVSLSEVRNITVSPSEPRFYGFNFPNDTDRVLLTSDSEDDICTILSVQTIDCPVFDLERDLTFEGQYETMSKKGGMVLERESYQSGFYVVFVVKGDDSSCTEKDPKGRAIRPANRYKNLTFTLKPGITQSYYLRAVFAALLVFLMFYIFSLVVLLCSVFRKNRPPLESGILSSTINEDIQEGDAFPVDVSTSTINPTQRQSSLTDTDSSIDEDDIDVMADADHDKDVYRTKPSLYVCDLARKHPRALQMKSQQYLWSLLTVGVFYALPVVQLVVTYQTVLHETGNLDLCYYNFRCAHPFGLLSDFNHVFSNCGYVLLGLLFILLTARRESTYRKQHHHDTGIPQHFGLFYAMGAALILEGILSASYHVCPNHSNFQFDTSFMYVISVLCMVKIYQNRHPDINARAYATFTALAGVIFISMWGVIGPSVYFWIGATALHVIICLLMSAQIYYMKRWTIELRAIRRVLRVWFAECRLRPLASITPKYPNRMVLLVI